MLYQEQKIGNGDITSLGFQNYLLENRKILEYTRVLCMKTLLNLFIDHAFELTWIPELFIMKALLNLYMTPLLNSL